MTRGDVERLLDMQVNAGRLTPQMKEEKLREFDVKLQEAIEQKNSGSGVYPRVGQVEGILSGTEILVVIGLVAMMLWAGKIGEGWLVGVTAGLLFTYLPIRIIAYGIKHEAGITWAPVIALLCGIGMLIWGFFTKFGSSEAKAAVGSYSDIIGCASIFLVGGGLIVGNYLSRKSTKNRYRYAVQATCVELKSPKTGHSVPARLSPIYEYILDGRTYRVQNGIYSTHGYPRAGEVRNIFVNPNDSYGYYDPIMSKATAIGMTCLGSFFIFMAVLVLVLAVL